jgi:hypothetical protein
MMGGQAVPALMAALLAEGVTADQIERAVDRVRSLRLGESITAGAPGPEQMTRAFVFEQSALLKRA